MALRWILGFAQISCLSLVSLFVSSQSNAAPVEASLIVQWEGRPIEALNLEALEGVRKKNPDVPVIHLINPSYFLDQAQLAKNLALITAQIKESDEVGLYLAPSLSLVKASDLVRYRKPTFWGSGEEVCDSDCGLQIPVTVYERKDIARLFLKAHQTLEQAGFTKPRTFAVHGWMPPAGIAEIAESLGYKHDLTVIDRKLVVDRIREYPLAAWLEYATPARGTPAYKAWQVVGGVLEFANETDISRSFEGYIGRQADPQQLFGLTVSQENLFISRQRLELGLTAMREKAKTAGQDLAFKVMDTENKGRPIAKKVRNTEQL